MTWSSLVVECLCIFFIWPLATRNITLVAIVMLHVGIDFSMNMHCFEWMSIMGWLFFLVRRESPNDKKATVATTSHSTIRRGLVNIFLLSLITIFVVDSVPLYELADLIPLKRDNVISSILREWNGYRQSVLYPTFFEPFMYPLGLFQGTWNLFTGTNDHNYRYEVQVRLLNGTEISAHTSPDWGALTWYEQKRWQRPMTFYENFEGNGCKDCYAQYYTSRLGVPKEEIASASIISTCEFPPDSPPPDNIWDWDWFFSPAKQPLLRRPDETIFTLNFCDDLDDQCSEWALRDGLCEADDDSDIHDMTLQCRRSCNFCHHDPDQLDVGTRISVYFSDSEHYFDATVRETKWSHLVQRYLVQYDGYENMEWTTAMALRRNGFHILRSSPSDDANPPPPDDEGSDEASEPVPEEEEAIEGEDSGDEDAEPEHDEEEVEHEEEGDEEVVNDEL
jgi:ShK domain-like